VHSFPLDMPCSASGKKCTSEVPNFPLVARGLASGKKCSLAGPASADKDHAAKAAARCCCGLTPRIRLNAVLSANGLP
jgi:hypothetical protein